jgi:hypothetical protein
MTDLGGPAKQPISGVVDIKSAAPLVRYSLSSARDWQPVVWLIGALVLTVLLACAVAGAISVELVVGLSFASLCLVCFSHRSLSHWPQGHLIWDEIDWQLESNSHDAAYVVGIPHVVLDLQVCLLLRWTPTDPHQRVRWLWLKQSGQPYSWHALRCAVYSRAR